MICPIFSNKFSQLLSYSKKNHFLFDFKKFLTILLAADGRLAQLGEHRPYKPVVAGSNPAAPTTLSQSRRGRS